MKKRDDGVQTQAVPDWMNWQNSTYARAYYLDRRRKRDACHTQLWGLRSAILVSMDGLADLRSEHSPSASRAGATSARVMMDLPPDPDLPMLRRFGAWGLWWVRLFVVHLPLRVMVVPFDLAHHDLHHSHALEKLAENTREEE